MAISLFFKYRMFINWKKIWQNEAADLEMNFKTSQIYGKNLNAF